MPESWTVAKGGARCSECGAGFGEGQLYFSALSEREQGFVREDFCSSCWRQAKTRPFFSFWKTRRRSDGRAPRVATDVVFDFFNKIQSSDRPDREEMRFVLALYLARRKALRFDGVREEEGREVLLFRRSPDDEPFRVEDPHLTEEQIHGATERLKELFRTES